MYGQVTSVIDRPPCCAEQAIHLLNISKQLERIADHNCNIAEDVLYLEKGGISATVTKEPREAYCTSPGFAQ